MDEMIRRRVIDVARYMIDHRATVRKAAGAFGLSKSSVHKDMSVRLRQISPLMHREVADLMQYNKAVRHLRGGESTRRRYLPRR